jgi:hypothetical protein
MSSDPGRPGMKVAGVTVFTLEDLQLALSGTLGPDGDAAGFALDIPSRLTLGDLTSRRRTVDSIFTPRISVATDAVDRGADPRRPQRPHAGPEVPRPLRLGARGRHREGARAPAALPRHRQGRRGLVRRHRRQRHPRRGRPTDADRAERLQPDGEGQARPRCAQHRDPGARAERPVDARTRPRARARLAAVHLPARHGRRRRSPSAGSPARAGSSTSVATSCCRATRTPGSSARSARTGSGA